LPRVVVTSFRMATMLRTQLDAVSLTLTLTLALTLPLATMLRTQLDAVAWGDLNPDPYP